MDENKCFFCSRLVKFDDPDTYHQVTSWVNGPKLDGPKLREQTGMTAHKECVDRLIAGQAADQPALFGDSTKTIGGDIVAWTCPACGRHVCDSDLEQHVCTSTSGSQE